MIAETFSTLKDKAHFTPTRKFLIEKSALPSFHVILDSFKDRLHPEGGRDELDKAFS